MSEKQVDKNEAEKIWDEIKDIPIAMFALPNQTIKDHVIKLMASGKDLVVKLASSSVLPALEEVLNNKHLTSGKKYKVEIVEGYTLISRTIPSKEEDIKKNLAPFLIVK